MFICYQQVNGMAPNTPVPTLQVPMVLVMIRIQIITVGADILKAFRQLPRSEAQRLEEPEDREVRVQLLQLQPMAGATLILMKGLQV